MENNTDRYVDGFVIPIPKESIDKYRALAEMAGEVWKEYGALEYYECLGDDLEVENMFSFKEMAGVSEDETVIFSWIVYESREHRDRVNESVMKDQRIIAAMEKEPKLFDHKRMAYGGFKPLVRF